MFSGTPDGQAPWVAEMSEGDDAGYFGPDSAVWHVNGAAPTLIAGIRALMMQTLHPGAMAGVHDHSRYHTDPLGRLAGTVRWVVVLTFGSSDVVGRELGRVARMHKRVQGDYHSTEGKQKTYSAADSDLIAWVHLVFTDAFLRSHQKMGRSIPDRDGHLGADRYVNEWAKAGILMGYPTPPRSERELEEALDDFIPQLRRDERVDQALQFIIDPPLPRTVKAGYWVLAQAAIASLEPRYRRLLGLRRPWWPALSLGRIMVAFTGWVLGAESPSMERARQRIDALPPGKREPLAA